MPFGDLALWGPARPLKVLQCYRDASCSSMDHLKTCHGKAKHGNKLMSVQLFDVMPCIELMKFFSFAQPWILLKPGYQLSNMLHVFRVFLAGRLPGIAQP